MKQRDISIAVYQDAFTLTLGLLLALPFCIDFPDAFDALGWGILAGGEIDLAGTVGGGPGSATGDLR